MKIRRPNRSVAGFSLIELMIVVSIIGVLAAIAYPGYRSFVIRSNRVDAQQVLLQASQRAERYYVTNGTLGYGGFAIGSAVNSDLMKSPAGGSTIYDVAVVGTPGSAFTIRATPVATGINKNDGYLEITSTGAKRWDRDNSGDTTGANESSWSR